jgi:hypothetical protein
MRGERGQTAAEFMGMLLIACTIIATIAGTDLDTRVETQTKRLICKIAGEDHCATPRTASNRRPAVSRPQNGRALAEAASAGPPIGHGRPVTVLPFPGSISVSCSHDKADPQSCTPAGRGGFRVTASLEGKVERSPTTLDATGCPWQNLAVSTTLKLTATGEAKGEKAGGSLQGYLGAQKKYQLTVSPAAADQIAKGQREPPNPVDVRSIKDGESILLTEESYAGLNLKGSYHELQLEMGYDRGKRVSSGIKRIDPNTLRIYVGDEDFVRQALKLGVDVKGATIAIGNTKDLSNGRLHSVDIDIHSNAGWNAYQQFLKSGKLPGQGAAGTFNPTRASTVHYSDTTELSAKLGMFQIGGQLNSSDGRLTQTRNADGSLDSVGTARIGNTEIAVSYKKDAAGHIVGEPTRSLILHDVDPSLIQTQYVRMDERPPASPGRDMRMDFSESDLRGLQQIALKSLARRIGGNPPLSALQRSLQQHHGLEVDYKGVRYDFGGVEMQLGAARNADEMLQALYHGGLSSAAVLQSLIDLPATVQRSGVPGTIVKPSC